MSHTCEDCGETFGTLTELRLHDCPGDETDEDNVCCSLLPVLAATGGGDHR